MPEVGQASHTVDEETIFTDIPVDTERLVGYAPIAPVQSESEEDEGTRAETSEPVWGGVMRLEDDDEDEDEEEDEATEADPEEGPEEVAVEPAGYHDAMGTTSDDIFEELTTHTVQLEDRVAHLEEQNAVHQEREDQYRDLAYQREAENTELRQQLQQLQQERTVDHRHLTEMSHRWVQAEDRADRLRTERDVVRTELQVLGDELIQTRADRNGYHAAWQIAVGRVGVLEEEVRTSAARIDSAGFALDTAFGRLRSRVRRYPREEDLWRQVISRRTVDRIARQEHQGAILRRGF